MLTLLRPEVVLAAELRASGRWNLAFDGHPHDVKFGLVVEGSCLLAIQGRPVKVLHAGDVFLLGAPPPYRLASDLKAPSQSASALLHRTQRRVAFLGSRRERPAAHVLGGRFMLDAANAHLLVEALPVFVHVPAAEAGPLRGVTQLLIDEVCSTQLGRGRAVDQLAQLVLTYTLRWLDAEGAEGRRPVRTGWLRALADQRIGSALRHIHANVKQGTSLAELARVAGMSRTAFAARFKELVGQPPLAYAIHWRMALARDALRTTDDPIGALAFELGYESESAFSSAFRREVGWSPRDYRQDASPPAVARPG